MRIARAPEERASRLAERVERADEREIAQCLLLQTHASRELVEIPERAAVFALGDDRLRLGVAERLHRCEPKSHVVNAALAMRGDRPGQVARPLAEGPRAAGDPIPI